MTDPTCPKDGGDIAVRPIIDQIGSTVNAGVYQIFCVRCHATLVVKPQNRDPTYLQRRFISAMRRGHA